MDCRAESCKISEQAANLDPETEEQARRALLEEELVNIPNAKCGHNRECSEKALPSTKNGAVKSKQRPPDLYDGLISYKYKVHMAAGLLPRGY